MSRDLGDCTLSTFTAGDGNNIALQDWPVPEGTAVRGTVVLVHGLGEHAGRYNRLARRLNFWGFAVRGYDQYGHGESDGARGGLTAPERLIDDLADVIESTRARLPAEQPLIVLGHSMGGLIAACLVALREIRIEGLVLSSPALDAGLNPLQKLLLTFLPRYAPNLTLGNGLDPDFLSHDPVVVSAYKSDPSVHDRISARLARFIADGGPLVLARAAQWKVPTLLMYAGADMLVNPRGSEAFAAAAPRQVVTARRFDDLFHEIFNELDAQPVFELLKRWLDERFQESAARALNHTSAAPVTATGISEP
jgi:alpha-beta hydrolase superfamily lysophospholipase